MGQYQQWLFAQEVDRRLRAELETLETELFYLQDRITILEQVVPATDNVILRALSIYLHNQESLAQPPAQQVPIQEKSAEQAQQAQPCLAPSQDAREEYSGPRAETPLPAGPAQEAMPSSLRVYTPQELSADMLAFFDQRSQTDPKLSALLQRERQRASVSDGHAHPIDEETRRLNENIQRWFVRWHRQIEDVPAEEVENE